MKVTRLLKVTLLASAAICISNTAFAQTRTSDTKDQPQRATIQRTAPVQAVRTNKTNDAAALRSSETQAAIAANVKNLSVSPARLERHKMRPPNVVGIVSDEGLDEKESDAPVKALISKSKQALQSPAAAAAVKAEIAKMPQEAVSATPLQRGIKGVIQAQPNVGPSIGPIGEVAAPPSPHLDVNGFGQAFHAAIKDNVAGYALRIGKNGQTIYTLQWNWAQTPSDSSLGWNPGRRMHIASVSKMITGMAMSRLLQEKGISYDAKIAGYLPAYWSKGSNIGNITFRQLMTHRSGFSTGSSSSNYQFMKSNVASGVPSTGGYDYENMNFGLCRILIAVINGNISKNAMFPAFINDLVWDAITIDAYEQYVNQKVFAPAGVNGPSLTKPGSPARAYPFPVSTGGWNSGDLTSMAGGAAWHMSINEILAVMHTFRRNNGIMAPSKAQSVLDAGFGIDRIINTSAGKLYEKNGLWRDGSQRTEQSVATFLPEGMDIVVFTNSPIGANGASLRNLVRDLYIANIVAP